MRRHNELVVSTFVALAFGVCACDHVSSSPSGPSGVAPHIAAVSPASPMENDRPQTLTIRGDGFESDCVITLIAPNGASTVFSGPLVQKLAAGLEVSATLSQAGAYALRASNASSVTSASFPLDVQSRMKPWIGGVTPGTLSPADAQQDVIVSGSGFAPGLVVTVVNGLDGTVIGDDADILHVTATSFTLRHAFVKPGSYALNLVSALGDPSNTVMLVVR